MVEIGAMKRRQDSNTSSFSYEGNTQKVKIIVSQISSKETRLVPLVLQTMTIFVLKNQWM